VCSGLELTVKDSKRKKIELKLMQSSIQIKYTFCFYSTLCRATFLSVILCALTMILWGTWNKSRLRCIAAIKRSEFNVQGSVHHKYIPLDILPTRCNITQFIYFWKTALHISGGISTHLQEHTQLYLQYLVLVKPLLLPAAIVKELELV